MKEEKEHHEELIAGISTQMKEILENSKQPMYIYLDDTHRICNKRFASLLGYKSPDEWRIVQGSFLDLFVAEKSQETAVKTYRKAMEDIIGSSIDATWKKKSGGTVDTNVILVPIAYQGHIFALHFISKK